MHSQQHAGAFLDRADDLGLVSKAKRLLELRQAVTTLLPGSLSRSCTVANARQGRVVIFAESSVVAAKLKLLLPALRNQLVEAGQDVTAVVVEVQPPTRRASTGPSPRQMSASAAAALQELSQSLPDSPLAQALSRLAAHRR